MRNWGWVVQYGIAIVLALLLGTILSDISLFRQTAFGHTKLRASHVVEFMAYGGALVLFWLMGHRAAAQFPEDGKGLSFLRRIIRPVVTVIIVLASYKVVWLVAGRFPHKIHETVYDWIFVLGILSAALWLMLACWRNAAMLVQAVESWTRSREAVPQQTYAPQVSETIRSKTSRLSTGNLDKTVLEPRAEARSTLGRYEVVKELGRGSMGVVYLGKDPTIHRFVALKTVRLDEGDDQNQLTEFKERFFREAESAGRLSHPHIVTIFDAGEEQDLGFIAMEVLEGATLKDWCRRDSLQPVKSVLDIVAKVAEALDYAHGHGIVHRDIKPANIMVTTDGIVKITDFGIARISTSTKTQTNVILGTPSYMSPEQIAGAKVDGRSDLFSLGVVLYELLTGEKPFQGETIASLMFHITNTRHGSPSLLRPDLPPCCISIIDKALCKDVTQRYQRGLELAEDLRTCLQTL